MSNYQPLDYNVVVSIVPRENAISKSGLVLAESQDKFAQIVKVEMTSDRYDLAVGSKYVLATDSVYTRINHDLLIVDINDLIAEVLE